MASNPTNKKGEPLQKLSKSDITRLGINSLTEQIAFSFERMQAPGWTMNMIPGVMKIYGDYANDIVLEMRDGTTVKYSVGAISTNTRQLKSGVIDEFVSSILENRTPIVTGIDGHNTLAIITKALQSDKEGKWLDIEY